MFRLNTLGALCCAFLFTSASVLVAQEALPTDAANEVQATAMLDQDGVLIGKVVTNRDGKSAPVEAKVTVMSAEGVVIDSIDTKEDGSFSFASLKPGTYKMFGTTETLYGASSVKLQPYTPAAPVQDAYTLDLQPTDTSYYDPGMYSSYCSSPAATCCGGGGAVGKRRFLRLAAIGGIIAIAVSDSSPDE